MKTIGRRETEVFGYGCSRQSHNEYRTLFMIRMTFKKWGTSCTVVTCQLGIFPGIPKIGYCRCIIRPIDQQSSSSFNPFHLSTTLLNRLWLSNHQHKRLLTLSTVLLPIKTDLFNWLPSMLEVHRIALPSRLQVHPHLPFIGLGCTPSQES